MLLSWLFIACLHGGCLCLDRSEDNSIYWLPLGNLFLLSSSALVRSLSLFILFSCLSREVWPPNWVMLYASVGLTLAILPGLPLPESLGFCILAVEFICLIWACEIESVCLSRPLRRRSPAPRFPLTEIIWFYYSSPTYWLGLRHSSMLQFGDSAPATGNGLIGLLFCSDLKLPG